jgi:translation initiation factor 5B
VKTPAQKKAEAKKAAMRAQFEAAGGKMPDEDGEAPKRRGFEKKKKRGAGPSRLQKKEEEEKKAREAAVAALKAKKEEEEAAKKAAEEAEAKAQEEDDDAAWDDSDNVDWEEVDVFIPKVAKLNDDSETDEEEEDEKRKVEEQRHKAQLAKKEAAKKAAAKDAAKDAARAERAERKGEDGSEDDGSEEETESETESESESDDGEKESLAHLSRAERDTYEKRKFQEHLLQAKEAREARHVDAMQNRSEEDLRCPILCVLGHVDTGKTKLLDKIRQSNVQDGEAGGITQQIGATYFPKSLLEDKTERLNKDFNLEYRIPGLLVIDTPGHESFTNLRSRGSSLCDIAILVVDMMHGLEPQTIESLEMLRARRTPFVVALNKVDRLYGWKACPNMPIREALSKQTPDVIEEYERRADEAVLAFAEQGLNASLYYNNEDFRKNLSLIPTSAHSGEGVADMLLLVIQLTQEMLGKKLRYCHSLQCSLLEVKVIEGLGTTIDVVLVNGLMKEGDTIVVCGMQGPIVTTIRGLLTPPPAAEMRVKCEYVHHKEIKAAMGIKVIAQNLEQAVPGTAVFVLSEEDDLEELKVAAMEDYEKIMGSVNTSGRGVSVQASTLGALEALLEFLKTSKIPVSSIGIGPIHKKDIIRTSVMLEHQPEYATMLAFDVKVEKDAKLHAEKMGVRIFTADIIYHLFDAFTRYMEEFNAKKKADAVGVAVFPCIVSIVKGCVFHAKNPIIIGCEIQEGVLRKGTPLCIPALENLEVSGAKRSKGRGGASGG